MRERRALRFLVEAIFLGALAAALVFTDLSPLGIAGVMLVGWLVVALYEWAATRELPHYGRGLPPRYYVPQVALPPRQLEQLRTAYPRADLEDEATWIATPAMRAEALAEWGVVDAPDAPLPSAPIEDTIVVDLPLIGASGEPFREDTWVELDPVAEGWTVDPEPEPDAAVAVAEPEVVDEEPEAVAVVAEPEPVVELEAAEAPVVEAIVVAETDLVDAPVVEPEAVVVAPEAESLAAPEVEPDPELDAPEVEPEAAAVEPDAAAEVVAEPEPAELELAGEPAAVAEPEPLTDAEEAEPEPVLEPAAGAAVVTEIEPEPVAEDEPEPALDVAAAAALAGAAAVVAEPEVEPEPERVSGLAASAAVVGAAVLADRAADAAGHAEPELDGAAVVVAEPEVLAEPEDDDTAEDAVQQKAPAPMRASRHTFDPLGDDAHPRRRFRRRSRDEPYVELPPGPPRPTALPGASRREE